MQRQPQRHYSIDDYFAVEQNSAIKHEYCNGEIFAMAGASVADNHITANVLSALRTALRGMQCSAFGSDLRLSTAAHNSARFTYVSPAGTIRAPDGGKHADAYGIGGGVNRAAPAGDHGSDLRHVVVAVFNCRSASKAVVALAT